MSVPVNNGFDFGGNEHDASLHAESDARIERLIRSAANAPSGLSESDIASQLVIDGHDPAAVFFAVKAAAILVSDLT